MTISAIPLLPAFFNMQCTQKGDQFSADFYLYLDQTFQVLNSIITANGIVMPTFTAAQVALFPTTLPYGTMWYNSDMMKLQVWVQVSVGPPPVGAIQTISSS